MMPRFPTLLPDEDTEAYRQIEEGFARWGINSNDDKREPDDIDHDDDWND